MGGYEYYDGTRILGRSNKGVALSKALPDVLKVMAAEEMGFVVSTHGQRKNASNNDALTSVTTGKQTSPAAGRKILNRIERPDLTFADIGCPPDEEVIVLRGLNPEKTHLVG